MKIPMENFKPFALGYLNEWLEYDSRFVAGLSQGNSKEARLRSIQEVAIYYRIARNFKTLPHEERLENALQALDSIRGPIIEQNVDGSVDTLATAFESVYGRHLVSAASKLLWMRYLL